MTLDIRGRLSTAVAGHAAKTSSRPSCVRGTEIVAADTDQWQRLRPHRDRSTAGAVCWTVPAFSISSTREVKDLGPGSELSIILSNLT